MAWQAGKGRVRFGTVWIGEARMGVAGEDRLRVAVYGKAMLGTAGMEKCQRNKEEEQNGLPVQDRMQARCPG